MKKLLFSLMSMLFVAIIVCCDDNEKAPDEVMLKNFANSGCKGNGTRASDEGREEVVAYSVIHDGYLYLNHQNVLFNCCPGEIGANITVEGNTIGSRELVFRPGKEQVYDIQMNIGTAGSVSLVLQAMFLAARNHRKRLTVDISGGTNVMWAPPIDSYQHLLFPLLKKMNINADVKIIDRGFYPQGGGRVIASLDPIDRIKPLDISSLGELKGIKGVCFSQRLPDWMTREMMRACSQSLTRLGDVDFEVQRTEGDSRGAGIVLVAEFENGMLGSNALTSRGHTPE